MNLLHHLVSGNWLIAISAGALTAGFSAILGFDHVSSNALLIGFGTLFIYNFQRILAFPKIQSDPHKSMEWISVHRQWMFASAAIGLTGSVVFSVTGIFTGKALGVLVVTFALGVLYAAGKPLLKRPLREVPYLKIHLISLVWLSCTGLFPWANSSPGDLSSLSFIAVHYFYVLAITIPFDIRDLVHDYVTQRTIPQILGIRGAKALALVILGAFLALILYIDISLASDPLFVLALLYQVILIIFSKTSRSDLYYTAGIDGGIILLGLAYLWY